MVAWRVGGRFVLVGGHFGLVIVRVFFDLLCVGVHARISVDPKRTAQGTWPHLAVNADWWPRPP